MTASRPVCRVLLRRLHAGGLTDPAIAALFAVTSPTIRYHRLLMQLPSNGRRGWPAGRSRKPQPPGDNRMNEVNQEPTAEITSLLFALRVMVSVFRQNSYDTELQANAVDVAVAAIADAVPKCEVK